MTHRDSISFIYFFSVSLISRRAFNAYDLVYFIASLILIRLVKAQDGNLVAQIPIGSKSKYLRHGCL